MNDDLVRAAVSRFVAEEFNLSPEDYATDTPLFSSGLLDSFAFAVIVMFIEQHFGIGIVTDELGETTFDTVDDIARYVSTRVAA